jgi:ribosomal protein L11 methyltransferase
MAFGTGTHATTSLCIRMIQDYLNPGDSFLDVGTGSGILMIAAAKLGAGSVTGVDNDEMAVAVAKQNLEDNGIHRFDLACANLVDPVSRPYNLVTANILAEVILDLLPDIPVVVKPEGLFICSGIIAAKKEMVLSGLGSTGVEVIDVQEMDAWVAIAARRLAG